MESIESFGVSCFIPCILLGNIRTRMSRESGIDISCCFNVKIGFEGLKYCFATFILTIICWPVSPLLALYLYDFRKRLYAVYDEESLRQPDNIFSSTTLLWPSSLSKQYSFLIEKEEEGILSFGWDLQLYKDYLIHKKPKYETKSLFIIGPNFPGKSSLISKFSMNNEMLLLMSHQKMKMYINFYRKIYYIQIVLCFFSMVMI
jgi:hypothetical protein